MTHDEIIDGLHMASGIVQNRRMLLQGKTHGRDLSPTELCLDSSYTSAINACAAATTEIQRLGAQLAEVERARPVAWVRHRGDGGIVGPLLDHQIEPVERMSWTPLIAAEWADRSAPQPPAAEQVAWLAPDLSWRNALITETERDLSIGTEPACKPLTDERIDAIADLVVKGMPDGIRGFTKQWGWRQFARALLNDCAGHYRAAEPTTAEPALEIRACECGAAKNGRCVMGDYGALPVGTKLYANTPRPVAEPARQKLTAAQVRRLYDNCPSEARDAQSFAAFRRIVELVESVHQLAPRPARPCRCGPDGCADSQCPGRSAEPRCMSRGLLGATSGVGRACDLYIAETGRCGIPAGEQCQEQEGGAA